MLDVVPIGRFTRSGSGRCRCIEDMVVVVLVVVVIVTFQQRVQEEDDGGAELVIV